MMLGRLRSLLRRRRLDAELAEELRHHLDALEAEHRARGLSGEEARRAAKLDLGGIGTVTEAYRDQHGIPVLETLWRTVRFSLRSLRRTPGVAAAVIVTLAVGIGANAAIFAVVNGVLLKPLPFPEAGSLIAVNHGMTGTSDQLPSAPYLYFTYREESRTLAGVGLWRTFPANVTGLDRPEQVRALLVTGDLLPLLGIQPTLGRTFTAAEDAPNGPLAVILTHGYWQRRFGGDASVIGRTLAIDGQPFAVIGVMPQRFRFLDQPVDIIQTFQFDRSQVTLGRYVFPSIARLKPGATIEAASADIARMVPLAIERFPPPPGYTRERFLKRAVTPRLSPLKDALVGDVGGTLWVVMGALGLLLLIACANVANLLLVRAEGRQQEIAVRAALGASRRRIAGELLVESTLLGIIGGGVGLLLAHQGLQAVIRFGPSNLPRLGEITIDPVVLLFTFGLSLVAGLLFGLLPVVKYANPRIARALGSGGRTVSGSRERHRARSLLVTFQIATALVLLVCSGLMIRTFQALSRVDSGFSQPDHVQMARISVPFADVPDPERVTRVQQAIVDRLAAIPGVTSAAFADLQPLGPANAASDTVLFVDGANYAPGQARPLRRFEFISPGLFRTLGTRLVAGRDFTWVDLYDKRPVAIVSENLAREEWETPAAALGKRVRASPDDPWREIVGVVADTHDSGMHLPPAPIAYFPSLMARFWSSPIMSFRSSTFLIRSPRAGTEAFIREVHSAVWEVNANLPLAEVRTLGDAYERSLSRTSFTLVILAIAGTMGLMLGAIGIYGVIAYVVSQRTTEIGVRLALGAQASQVRRLFVRDGLVLAAAGAAAGIAGALLLTRLMSSLLFGVSRLDPLTFALTTLLLMAVATLAAYVPARRATRNDPIDALRYG